ncbi:MAG: fibronectin type III domain-containing protein [Lentimicrobiaceae bacterium]|nr:fibronectin type III domain-containing protein [Lentimicrobiaceae bacterium]
MKKFTLLYIGLFIVLAMNLNAQTVPANLQIIDYGYHFVKLSATANASGNNILIAMTDVPKTNMQGQVLPGGTFGTPQGTYQVGDEIEGGGTIVYLGGTNTNILLEGLTDNVIYHFQAWSVSGGTYSANYLAADFLTWGKVPYISDYTREELGEVPFDWYVLGDGDIYKQNCLWGTKSWLQQSTINGMPGDPVIMSLTTQWILLGEGKNSIHFRYYFAVPTFATFYTALQNSEWEDETSFQIQLSNDDVNFVTIFTLNKNNAPDIEYPREDDNMETLTIPPFPNFNGERVKVRILWTFAQKVQTHIEDIFIELAEPAECDGVYNLAVNQQSLLGGKAEIYWDSYEEDADLWEIRYRIVGENEWTEPLKTSINPYLLSGLPFETRIEVQIRVVCSETSVSDWGSFIFMTGPEFLPCEYPVNLNVTEITSVSARLSWEKGSDEDLSWDLRYRDATTTAWNNVEDLEVKSYLIEELTPNTAYLWTVRAHCSNDRTSPWATQGNFSTIESSINDLRKEWMTVFASGKMINIINVENRYIETVQLFNITGALLCDFKVNTTDNVLIPTALSEMIAFVKIIGKDGVETHKVLIK